MEGFGSAQLLEIVVHRAYASYFLNSPEFGVSENEADVPCRYQHTKNT